MFLSAKILLFIILGIQAGGAIFFIIKNYKGLINASDIKEAIEKKNITKLKAIISSILKTIKTAKFLVLLLAIAQFIILWFAI